MLFSTFGAVAAHLSPVLVSALPMEAKQAVLKYAETETDSH